MKRYHVTVAMAIIAMLGLASAASAQQRGGRGFGGGGTAGLLMIEEVQKELNITTEQKDKLQAALRGERGNTQNLSREERQKRFEELAKKADETVKSVLDEKQQTRLEELRIQREGASSLERAEVVAKLGLDQAQKDQIKKIQADNASTARFDFQNATAEERQKFMTEARERREKTNTALLAVLTPAQKESFEKMQGEKFTFPRRAPNNNRTN
jgi:Spy/CpxP family protein refolding chaperone